MTVRARLVPRALPARALNTLPDSFSALISHKADQSVVSNMGNSSIHHFISSSFALVMADAPLRRSTLSPPCAPNLPPGSRAQGTQLTTS